jgi:hypothetical protein
MRSLLFRFGLTTAAVAIAVTPALAQKPGESGGSPAADRPVAVERPAAGGGDSSARSAAPAASSSTTSPSSPSATSIPTMGFGASRAAYREEAPQHRASGGSASSASSGHAVARGSGGSSAAGSNSSSSSSGAKSSSPAREQSGENHAGGSQAVPDWARPRGGQPATGTAVTRTTPRPSDDHGHYYNNYYNPFGYYYGPSSYYYGNYFYGGAYYSPYYYAPYMFSPYVYSPYMLGYGFGLGFPWGIDPGYGAGYGADDYWYGGGGGNYSSSQPAHGEDQGGLRLKVKPRDAKVYVDGYFVGTIDTMDGVFQKLPLNSGRHHVSVKADGYQPEEFDVVITPNETATYQGDLKKGKS